MVPFQDLKLVDAPFGAEIQAAALRALRSGWYVLGPEVERFEAAFAAYHGIAAAVGVANGTDAIELALRALDIGRGDEVITVAHTAAATVTAIERAGATPVLADIDPVSYTLDARAAAAAIGRRTRAIVPVHLYGQPADMAGLMQLAERHHLAVVEDCAQAHGARYDGRLVGTLGHLAAFSFYPTKNLGAYGDGGMVLTRDERIAARLRRLRSYGQTDRYHHAERGVNSRLDEVQAAILSVKLAGLDINNARRRALAARYDRLLRGVAAPQSRRDGHAVEHVYHLYAVRHPRRDALRTALHVRGVGTLVHYPLPLHLQAAFADWGYRAGSLPVTERVAAEVLSLPLYPGLRDEQVDFVAECLDACQREAAA